MPFSPIFLLSLLLIPSPSAANEGNILATGDILPTDAQLSYKDFAFVIQDDCNLVLYNKLKGFQSNTHGLGTNCSLTLSNFGELIIKDRSGSIIWSSPGGNKIGKYAAVLGPNGQVNVYGPSVWSTPVLSSSPNRIENELNSVPPFVRNVLFSSNMLKEKLKLWSRDYSLEVTDACDLEFRKASVGLVWHSETKGMGQHCFARLDQYGLLSVVNDRNKVLWTSGTVGAKGDYVLVVQIHGQVVVYGPVVWSTAD